MGAAKKRGRPDSLAGQHRRPVIHPRKREGRRRGKVQRPRKCKRAKNFLQGPAERMRTAAKEKIWGERDDKENGKQEEKTHTGQEVRRAQRGKRMCLLAG